VSWCFFSEHSVVTLSIAQAAASQPADRPVTAATVGLHARISFKNVIFGNDDSFRHKTQQMFCTWSGRVCLQNFAVVWHGVWEEIGLRQN